MNIQNIENDYFNRPLYGLEKIRLSFHELFRLFKSEEEDIVTNVREKFLDFKKLCKYFDFDLLMCELALIADKRIVKEAKSKSFFKSFISTYYEEVQDVVPEYKKALAEWFKKTNRLPLVP